MLSSEYLEKHWSRKLQERFSHNPRQRKLFCVTLTATCIQQCLCYIFLETNLLKIDIEQFLRLQIILKVSWEKFTPFLCTLLPHMWPVHKCRSSGTHKSLSIPQAKERNMAYSRCFSCDLIQGVH